MIAQLVALIRPLYMPILALPSEPPALPDPSVEVLRPTARYLQYRYLAACAGLVPPLAALLALTLALALQAEPWAWLAALPATLGVGLTGLVLVLARVDWELQRVAIGEHALRLRHGAWTVREVTLSYANIQNVEIVQGPIEQLFHVESVRITTAGSSGPERPGQPMERGAVLVGLERAAEVRAQILERLKQHRDAGLGDRTAPGALQRRLRLTEIAEAARRLERAAKLG